MDFTICSRPRSATPKLQHESHTKDIISKRDNVNVLREKITPATERYQYLSQFSFIRRFPRNMIQKKLLIFNEVSPQRNLIFFNNICIRIPATSCFSFIHFTGKFSYASLFFKFFLKINDYYGFCQELKKYKILNA